MSLAPNDENSARVLVDALEQQQSQKPVSEVVGCESGIQAVFGPRLLAKVEKACVKDESADRWNLAS